MKQLRPPWLCALTAALVLPVCAQTPVSLGPLHVVSYDHGSGFVSYVIPCKQPIAGLPPAICWVMRAGELQMVEGKLQASKLSTGGLSISAQRVFFRAEELGAVTIDLDPASVKIAHAIGKPYAVLTSGGHSFVIAELPLCPTCPGEAQAVMPAGLNFEDEYNDLAASLRNFDAVLKRLTEIAAQAPEQPRLPSVVSDPLLVSSVPPAYPAVARAGHVEGRVVIQAILSKEGFVTDAKVLSGPELLRDAALTAVKQWKYKPYLVNGAPSEVATRINVNFTLGPSGLAGRPLEP